MQTPARADQELAAGGPDAIAEALRPLARSTAAFAVSITGGFGSMVVHVLLESWVREDDAGPPP